MEWGRCSRGWGKYLWRNTWGRHIKKWNGQMEIWGRCFRGGLNTVKDSWNDHPVVKRKEWHASQFDRGKEDCKLILPVPSPSPPTTATFFFVPFSHIAKHKPSRCETGSLCLWLWLFVSKVTSFSWCCPLGWHKDKMHYVKATCGCTAEGVQYIL